MIRSSLSLAILIDLCGRKNVAVAPDLHGAPRNRLPGISSSAVISRLHQADAAPGEKASIVALYADP